MYFVNSIKFFLSWTRSVKCGVRIFTIKVVRSNCVLFPETSTPDVGIFEISFHVRINAADL